MDTYWFDFIILPLLIFTARIFDVSLDTIRVIMVSTLSLLISELVLSLVR